MPTLEAPIVAVTVFVHRARVIRRGKIALDAGEHTLILDTLPETLEADSVRASGRGAGVTLLGVDVKTEYVTQAPQQAIANMEKEAEAVNIELQRLSDEVEALQTRLETLTSYGKNSSRKLAQSTGTLDALTELGAYLVQQIGEVHAALRENAHQQRHFRKFIAALEAKLREIRQPAQHKKHQLNVAVRVDAPVEFELEIAYAVTGAVWQSGYDVRLREDGEVELTYLASVWQKTGEDWNNVDLALSTARPAISITLPELPTWYLFDRRNQEGAQLSRMKMQVEVHDGLRMAKEQQRIAEPKPKAHIAQTTIEEVNAGSTVTYKIGTPTTIPADNTPYKTTVAITRLRAKLDYVAAPKIALEAYLRATIMNTSPYILLPGDVSIFHEDEFVGKTKIDLIAPNEEFEVQLGVDDHIKVLRELVNREASRSFIGLARRVSFGYRITVTNLLPTSAKINIRDHYPVPHEANIHVVHDDVKPAPTKKTDLGGLTWTFELAPNAKQEITFAFTVEYPRDAMLNSLPD